MPAVLSKNAPCPCGSGRKAKGCCAAVIGGLPAGTPEALMRSRYTAYATGQCAHLVATTHPTNEHWRSDVGSWRAELAEYCAAVQFVGLTVAFSKQAGDHGEVMFEARYTRDGSEFAIVEHSTFVREHGRWFYVSAKKQG